MKSNVQKISGDTIMEYYLSKTNGGKEEEAKTRIGKQIRSLFPAKKSAKIKAAFFAAVLILLSSYAAYMFLGEGIKRFDWMLLSVGILIVLWCICAVSFLSTTGEASIYDMLCTYQSKHGGKLPSGEEAARIIAEDPEKQEEVRLLEIEFASRK